jgi:hypothetical protein
MDMDYKWFSGYQFCSNSSRISKPIMCMNDVKMLFISKYGCYNGIICNFLEKILAITPAETKLPGERRLNQILAPGFLLLRDFFIFLRSSVGP